MNRDHQDLIAGAFMLLIGVTAVLYSSSYDPGTWRQAGPGLFPTILGFIMLGLGAFVFLPAFFRSGPPLPSGYGRQLVTVVGSIILFGLTIQSFGLVPATILLVFVSSYAESKTSLVEKALLSLALTALAAGIFYYGLGLQFKVIAWPF